MLKTKYRRKNGTARKSLMNVRSFEKHSTRHGVAARQRGAVLVMALVILLVMTLLGVTIMRTSSLEEKMAGNMQTVSRAIDVAESCLNNAYETNALDRNTLKVGDMITSSTPVVVGSYSAKVTTKYLQNAHPPRADGPSASSAGNDVAYYQITCVGNAGAAGVSATVANGLYQQRGGGS